MDKKYLILSDIHGNVSAFNAVLRDCMSEVLEGVFLLGDCIDYGMRSNEIIEMMQRLEKGLWKNKIVVNIWGNHEKILIDKSLERLSSERGRVIANYTAKHLSTLSVDYINSSMNKNGFEEFNIDGFLGLAVHGSLEDYYWKAISPDNVRDDYSDYNLVFSGHSHYSHYFSKFYPITNKKLRNKKAVVFVNPGSVGQPRNQNPCAQYALLSLPSRRVEMRAIEYDVKYEQSLFPDEIDEFYKNRLMFGV